MPKRGNPNWTKIGAHNFLAGNVGAMKAHLKKIIEAETTTTMAKTIARGMLKDADALTTAMKERVK